ncbi:MAG: DNA polymerase I [Candidatus Kerfeldbacteria bacterium RIFCSPHIGHO2_02_FULL_42_14]|uniref:DNA polymerase I n=1 Tax=Candidatus Kerfeldbacteria bacterium RIFCSPHIGHO2_02_FULL_42_14 TaxID=1798540 RepID=A0A1G2AQG0_9BACT|nr:MAG: DNA polymerase I [Candidatus Kerfeldbacteria bacterium RIFCSPHIGHO2_02_FULL_42_14]OGY81231.1 MAG: DNA polymerase I [Candidatus Kerfeldbacteria bacterium RIFCSPHIGHO2_12_FULL_42_13]OGY83349.1 MAG: DNA polymerase I [Candidatus Kerfeldbacteria bacterium RIFCSPLOWO2_02_FULL_42_19]
MAKKVDTCVIIDGNAIIHRAFHALPPLTTRKGELVNAIYGFTSVLLKMLKELKPRYALVAFDPPGKTFRHEIYTAYKATRVKQPDELYAQIPKIKEIVSAFRIPQFEKPGVEADDVIGTLKTHIVREHPDVKVVIVTGDLDTLQLIDDRTVVYTLKRGVKDTVIYDRALLKERFGLTPAQVIDYKALRGDPSDNIPGVAGIGEKGALTLLKHYKTLEGVYRFIDALTPRLRKALRAHKDDAFLSQNLATIRNDVPLRFHLSDAELPSGIREELIQIFQRYEFKSLLSQLSTWLSAQKDAAVHSHTNIQTVSTQRTSQARYELIDTPQKFQKFFANIRKQKLFAIDTETSALDPIGAELLGASFCWHAGEAYYVVASLLPEMRSLLSDPIVSKVGHNIKYDIQSLGTAGLELSGVVFDTMIASYVLNPEARVHKLDRLAFSEFGYEMMPIEVLIGKGREQISMKDVPVEKVAWYAAEDADFTFRLYQHFLPEMTAAYRKKIFQDIEIPLIPILAEMERCGIRINVPFLKRMSRKFFQHIATLKRRIYTLAGMEFNVASPVQLKQVLFERLKLPTRNLPKTKTGVSTSADALEKLRGAHPIIDEISEFREYTKLQSTYIDALPQLVHPKTGRVHTSFNQTITATGRLSSSNPNLQNIPIRTELGREIRKAFIAENGYKIISADYSQIELRIVAHLANDPVMLETFRRGEDIHTATAAALAGVDPKDVTKDMRRAAKSVNFGILYGMGPYGIARDARISREEATAFLESYFGLYKDVKQYLDCTIEEGRRLGYTETIFGRRRYLPELQSGIVQLRSAAERMATNMPVQGTEADIVKLAMIRVHEWMQKHYTSDEARMLLQVHDELVFEVHEAKVAAFTHGVRKSMEEVCKLKCPLVVEVKTGMNWGTLEVI